VSTLTNEQLEEYQRRHEEERQYLESEFCQAQAAIDELGDSTVTESDRFIAAAILAVGNMIARAVDAVQVLP
jgi:hypothetical protein